MTDRREGMWKGKEPMRPSTTQIEPKVAVSHVNLCDGRKGGVGSEPSGIL